MFVNLQNLRITHNFSKEYFEELTSSPNGSYHIVRVLKDGTTGIRAELVSVLQQVREKDARDFLQNVFSVPWVVSQRCSHPCEVSCSVIGVLLYLSH